MATPKNGSSVTFDPALSWMQIETAFGRSFAVYIALTQPPREGGVRLSGGEFDHAASLFFRAATSLPSSPLYARVAPILANANP
jgi:hypothetical protein